MSEDTDGPDQNDLDNLLAGLHQELQKHRDLLARGKVRVSVDIPEDVDTARTSRMLRRAGDARCVPDCPRGTRCKLDPFTLEWFCD